MYSIGSFCKLNHVPVEVFASHLGMTKELLVGIGKLADKLPHEFAVKMIEFCAVRDQTVSAYISDIRNSVANLQDSNQKYKIGLLIYNNAEDFGKAQLAYDITYVTHAYFMECVAKGLLLEGFEPVLVTFDNTNYCQWLVGYDDSPVARAFWAFASANEIIQTTSPSMLGQ